MKVQPERLAAACAECARGKNGSRRGSQDTRGVSQALGSLGPEVRQRALVFHIPIYIWGSLARPRPVASALSRLLLGRRSTDTATPLRPMTRYKSVSVYINVYVYSSYTSVPSVHKGPFTGSALRWQLPADGCPNGWENNCGEKTHDVFRPQTLLNDLCGTRTTANLVTC